MKTKIIGLQSILILTLLAWTGSSGQALAQTESIKEEVFFSEWIPCANDGNGEIVSGTLVLHTVIQLDNDLSFKKIHLQPQYSQLVGEQTGSAYHVNGADNYSFDVNDKGGSSTSYITRYHVLGDGVRLSISINSHTTVNANGEVTSEIETESVQCQ